MTVLMFLLLISFCFGAYFYLFLLTFLDKLLTVLPIYHSIYQYIVEHLPLLID